MTRRTLPQLDGTQMFVTDGGLETELVFHDGLDLPCFAAFPLLDQLEGATRLRRYYDGYLDIAREHAAGFVVETPTWRANPTGPSSSATRRRGSMKSIAPQWPSPRRSGRPRQAMASPPS
jgi:S-methylmethionine-dependent homocysteine/selenocysteine methylase